MYHNVDIISEIYENRSRSSKVNDYGRPTSDRKCVCWLFELNKDIQTDYERRLYLVYFIFSDDVIEHDPESAK